MRFPSTNDRIKNGYLQLMDQFESEIFEKGRLSIRFNKRRAIKMRCHWHGIA